MRFFSALSACFALLPASITSLAAADKPPPNIILIIADDLGFSDLGCYGGEIQTPALDSLAANGTRFTQAYNTGRCWPTRSSLLSGYYPQEIRRGGFDREEPRDFRSGDRPEWAKLLPQHLAAKGYRSYHTGKWHIDAEPMAGGFHRSYYLRDQGRFFHPKVHYKDGEKLPPVDPDSEFYATINLGEHVRSCLSEHAAHHADKPFFHYIGFSAPHFPLQALPEDIALYDEIYQQGWDVIREKRWQRIQKLGLLSGQLSSRNDQLGAPYDFQESMSHFIDSETLLPRPWEKLPKAKQDFQAKKMAIHAAMIHRMDIEIGKVITHLRELKLDENTLVMFLSDNGASAELMVRDDGHDPEAPMGSAATYLCLGPGWSTAANTPFRKHKTWVHEGGIRTPFISSWLGTKRTDAQLNSQPFHVVDIVPSILGLVDHTPESTIPLSGEDLSEQLFADTAPTPRQTPIYFAHDGHRGVRADRWKLVATAGSDWELYDMTADPAETADLASEHPEILTELQDAWETWAELMRERRSSDR